MKLNIADDVNANVRVVHEIPTQDLEDLIEKATDAVVTIIGVYTVAQIFKSIFDR